MATIDEIKELWAEDSRIKESELARESLRTPHLHSKYLDMLINAKMKVSAYQHDLARMQQFKTRYYKGELTKEELVEYDLPQWQYNKPLKSEIESILNADADCIKIRQKIDYISLMVFQLENIMQAIKGRPWDIRNSIEFLKYQSGL